MTLLKNTDDTTGKLLLYISGYSENRTINLK